SLSSLGHCISALAAMSKPSEAAAKHVPYHNSVLTKLLKNSLGGNAKTIMLAAISPADVHYEETLATLRYANRAKRIKNQPIINDSPNEKLMQCLKSEIEALRAACRDQLPPAVRRGHCRMRSAVCIHGASYGIPGS
ncbi:kif1, partial [Symbiodinium sp. KB8]